MLNERHFFLLLYNQNVNEIRFQFRSLPLLKLPVILAIISCFLYRYLHDLFYLKFLASFPFNVIICFP